MFHFCGAEALPPTAYGSTGIGLSGRVARLLWRKSSRPERALLAGYQARRVAPTVPQPGPYWAMEAGAVTLVSIDTGVDGSIHHEQAAWLLSVSREPGPKILLTGKPLVVNHRHDPGSIISRRNPNDQDSVPLPYDSVDAVVAHNANP